VVKLFKMASGLKIGWHGHSLC